MGENFKITLVMPDLGLDTSRLTARDILRGDHATEENITKVNKMLRDGHLEVKQTVLTPYEHRAITERLFKLVMAE